MKAKVKFLQEEEGKQSLMRLLSLLSFCVAVYIALYTIHTKQPGIPIDSTTMTFFGFFIIGAFVPKFIQKFAETQGTIKSTTTTETEVKTEST